MICANPDCEHPAKLHDSSDGHCRRTRCKCAALVIPEPEQAIPGGRRVCVDVPDGYMLTVSLVPYTETKPEAEK